MAKSSANSGAATLLDGPQDDDFYRPPAAREGPARTPRPVRSGADAEADEPFLRARRRVPIQKGLLPAWARTRWGRVLFAAGVLAIVAAFAIVILTVRSFLDHDAHFRIESSTAIQTVGNSELSRADLLSVFGSDIGRNIFFVPLAKRRAELEQIPWVESATVMRVLPNQLRIAVRERMPIAFVQVRGRIALADVAGVILDMTPREMAAKHYSFPVVSGIDPADPLSVRNARMHIYQRFLTELDSTGEHFSAQLSEIDLSDPEDVRATVPASGSDLLLHFGQEDFLNRWRNYQAHIAQWRQQYPHLASVDLRYEHEVVLKMAGDVQTGPPQSLPSQDAPSAPQPAPRPAATHRAQAAKRSPQTRARAGKRRGAA